MGPFASGLYYGITVRREMLCRVSPAVHFSYPDFSQALRITSSSSIVQVESWAYQPTLPDAVLQAMQQ